MKAAPPPESSGANRIWLELLLDSHTHTFEFVSSESAAITVGSHPSADLRIDRPGVAPVQFHIEREAEHLWLVPAYDSERLRVNAARLAAPKCINGPTVIEFCGLQVRARVLSASPVPQQATESFSAERFSAQGDTVEIAPFWLRAPDHCAAASAEPGAQSTTVFDVPCVPARQRAALAWLARLGVMTQRKPRVVWVVATVCAFVVSASLSFTARHVQRAAPPQATKVFQTGSSRSAPPPLVLSSAALASSLSPSPVVIIAAAPSFPSVATKGRPSDPELVAAVAHVISGRYKDAQQAYTALAMRSPTDPCLAFMARLLARKSAPECSGSQTDKNVSCPEVKP
jgi:hypothetical protein